MEIRAIAPAMTAVMAELHRRCFTEAWPDAAFAVLVASPGTFGSLALLGTVPSAFILCRLAGDDSELLTLGVVPDHRRRGLARALLRDALDQAARMGARRMVLEVAADNLAALALYGGVGFTAIGRRRAYYRGPGQPSTDALVLARPLPVTAAPAGPCD